MDIKQLKTYIFENQKVPNILSEIGCHHIKYHSSSGSGYWICGNYNGDNQQAITVYANENLSCINYTRDLGSPSDLLSLVCFNKKCSFFEALKWLCSYLGISYYHDFDEEVPESLKITKLLYEMQQGNIDFDDKPLKPISEKILSYYYPYVNNFFFNDNISYETQREFEIGYDPETNRITIPLRSEIGDLVGVQGRLFKQGLTEDEQKYLYIEPCSKSKILYGLQKTYPYIQRQRQCYVLEAPKGTMQLWDIGVYNSVATLGTKISAQQIEKLTRLGVDLIFAYDKDVTKKMIEEIADRFVDGVQIYYLFDDKNILNDKQSPSDDPDKWQRLNQECFYKIK
jgi:DNA primase